MNRVSTVTKYLLVFVILSAQTVYAGSASFPLAGEPDLSSGFGDWRARRFHAGIDLRTGGKAGKKVTSPVKGYLYRVRTSYDGYGKAVYIYGEDDHIYVFAHLENFSGRIDSLVFKEQVASKRYKVDISPAAGSFAVTEGELLGLSGQTGSGAPHLHFEKRTSDNLPLNPLSSGFELADKVRPFIARVGFKMTDATSLFEDGSRSFFVDAVAEGQPGKYGIAEKLYFNRPFGILLDAFDRMNPNGMRQSVYNLTVRVDGRDLYVVKFDTLDFDFGKMSDLEYVPAEVAEGRKSVRQLYQAVGNRVKASRAASGGRGIIGENGSLEPGEHSLQVLAVDAFGNKSELSYDFWYGPQREICSVDSMRYIDHSQAEFFMASSKSFDALNISDISVEIFARDGWTKHHETEIVRGDSGQFKLVVNESSVQQKLLRLALTNSDGCKINGEPFNGIMSYGSGKGTIEHEMIADGLLIRAKPRSSHGGKARILLMYKGEVLGIVRPERFFSPKEYIVLVPPDRKYQQIDSIAATTYQDRSISLPLGAPVAIQLLGDGPPERAMIDSYFEVAASDEHFYTPMYIELMHYKKMVRIDDAISDRFLLLPRVFVTEDDFEISLKLRSMSPAYNRSGLCWLDEEKNEWVWLEESRFDESEKELTATSRGGGFFAAMLDEDPPIISRLSVKKDQTYYRPERPIKFSLVDTFSGIADDRSISVKIDGQWAIPEYDPESKICLIRTTTPLLDGDHHLAIEVTDRAGNVGVRYVQFKVKARPKPPKAGKAGG
ncbi:MAG: hypothetical protein V3T31_11110 [candidate division Zixibacteria bacterium]